MEVPQSTAPHAIGQTVRSGELTIIKLSSLDILRTMFLLLSYSSASLGTLSSANR